MSFLYPRTISISRPNVAASGGGVKPYGGLAETNETVVISGVSASIQKDRQAQRPLAGVPSDATGRGSWRIFFNLPLGTVQKNDVITDDLGVRYQVTMPYWNSLGYQCLSEQLSA